MPDREKVIDNLEYHIHLLYDVIPHVSRDDGEYLEAAAKTMSDAIILLKAQEPRVLALDEIHRGMAVYSYPKTMWKCRCDCGNIITVAAEKLKTGSTKSCGCYKRTSGEVRIAELLDSNGIDYLYDKPCFDDLVLPGGSIGRYDFVLFDGQHNPYRIIEFDGEEHKASNKPSALYSEARLNQIRQYDAIKNEYAMKRGIPLVRIPYSEKGAITLDLLLSNKYLVSV